MKKIILFFAIFASTMTFSQVGIGTNTPNPSSILDLDVSSLPANGKKGFLGPRVALTSSTDQTTIPSPATGLIVYNTGTGALTVEGYLYWNGTEWRTFDNTSAISPAISSLNCLSAELLPGSYTSGTPYVGNLTIPYSGGNGGAYSSGATIIINKLEFKLRPGKLEFGDGELVFSVSGTPSVSSPTTTTIPVQGSTGNNLVPFLPAAQHCSATVGNFVEAVVQSTASIVPLTWSNEAPAGWASSITSPDGKFSVRIILPWGQQYQNADMQIRSNDGTPTIMWNMSVDWVGGSPGTAGNNGMTFPSQGVWYGNGGSNSTTMSHGANQSIGDNDVYFNSPEYRRLTWTTTNSNDKTMYTLEFMMGASSPSQVANDTNCPSGTCNNTKVFLKLTETKG